MRWPMWAARVSVERPEASGREMKAEFQPLRLSLRDVLASSVTVSTAMPPISSRALRRMTALEPQNIVAFHVSLPFWMKSWKSEFSIGMARSRCMFFSKGSGE